MSQQITTSDIGQSFWNTISRNVGLSDIEIYGTDFKDSWINQK